MRNASLLTLACAVCVSFAVSAADNSLGAFRSKMKPGLYEYKMEMDMGQVPGMPPGMGKQTHSFQHCVTQEDIDRGAVANGNRGKGGMPENCKIENMRMSGNTADYTLTCKGGPDMTSDNHVVFTGDGYKVDSNMAMNEGGHAMHMKQHMEGRYLGACKQ